MSILRLGLRFMGTSPLHHRGFPSLPRSTALLAFLNDVRIACKSARCPSVSALCVRTLAIQRRSRKPMRTDQLMGQLLLCIFACSSSKASVSEQICRLDAEELSNPKDVEQRHV